MDDEVPHNQRSGEGILPILGCLVNLPPEIRTNFENLQLFGYWVGSGHPNMQVLMEPIVDDMINAFTKGVTVKMKDQVFTSKAAVAFNDSDMRLKELIQNHSGSTSFSGCDKCYIIAKTVRYASGGTARKFVISDITSLPEKRTAESWANDVSAVTKLKKEMFSELSLTHTYPEIVNHAEYSRLNSKGIKGPSVFDKLPYVDISKFCLTQPMHCIFEK